MLGDPLPWDYDDLARERMRDATRALDLGTGGGEVLSRLGPYPRLCVATEAWPPNVAIAAARLRPLGVNVIATSGSRDNDEQPDTSDRGFPFRDASFDLVLDRHEAFAPREVRRVLRRHGRLLTQQVGPDDDRELTDVFGAGGRVTGMTLERYRRQLEDAGLRVLDAREGKSVKRFLDVGAVVYYLRAVPWRVAGFSAARFRRQLEELDARIRAGGPFVTRAHRFLIEAVAD